MLCMKEEQEKRIMYSSSRVLENQRQGGKIMDKALRDMIVEITEAQHILITNKKVTDDFEKKKGEVDEAIVQLRPFVNQIRATTAKDREKLVVMLHSLDHLARLSKVLNDVESINAINNQQHLMAEWYGVLTEIKTSITDDQQLEQVSTRLEETSLRMAKERRKRRKQYFVRTAHDDAQLDVVISKVEALGSRSYRCRSRNSRGRQRSQNAG